MVAEITYPDGIKKVGVIGHGIDKQGRCYHRMFSIKQMEQMSTEALSTLLSFEHDVSASDDYSVEKSGDSANIECKDELTIDPRSGVATIRDATNKCTIRVARCFDEAITSKANQSDQG
jgi:hypothetical protein